MLRLARFARGANLLVINGATYGRRIFTHLRIDDDLPSICECEVDRIFLTQIGRSAPPHEQLLLDRNACSIPQDRGPR